MKNKYIKGAVILGASIMASEGIAASMDTVKIDGFLSTRYSVTDDPAFYLEHRDDGGINEDGSFYGTKLGLNISTQVNDKLSVATQLLSSIQEGGYSTTLDWAFANISLSPDLDLRVGKIKYPVGLVNEYVDVGVAYPWIQAPVVIYSELPTAAQATREAYTGLSFLKTMAVDDWTYSADFFAGQVDLTGMTIKKLLGVSFRANWDDVVEMQLATYQGTMKPTDLTAPMATAMDGKTHSATTAGIKADWNNVIAYAEYAKVEMDTEGMMKDRMNSDSWYATLGYRMGQWMPHVTVQDWQQKSGMGATDGYGSAITTVGLNYSISPKTVVKFEVSTIETDQFNNTALLATEGVGLFPSDSPLPADDSTQMYSIALDTVF